MGIFRFILAASVILAHSSSLPGLSLLDAGLAVKSFFIISGFYMQLIMDSKYGRVPHGTWLFYTNRFLRIYPMYLLTLAFAVAFYFAASFKLGHPADRLQFWVAAWHLKEFGPLALIFFSQFSIFGLDITPIFSFSPTTGFHLMGYSPGTDWDRAWRFNFMPHCWSIGAELLFYTLMPLLNLLRHRTLLILALLGFIAREIIVLSTTPDFSGMFNYHFGPMQIPFFVLGILTYRLLYKRFFHKKAPIRWPLLLAAAFLAAATITPAVSRLPLLQNGYLGLAALTIPILFHLTRLASWDRWIGELSYPMYLLHIPLKWVILALMGVSQKDTATVSGLYLLAFTVAVSIAMTYLVDRPMERFRRERFEKEAGPIPKSP
jgi:peptidoglycan/LPS O-acetylase OafA/YrhL